MYMFARTTFKRILKFFETTLKVTLGLALTLIIFFSFPGEAQAAPAHNHESGNWTDNFTDNTGLSAKSNMDVDTSDGKLKLTNASGGFMPPYNSSGYARSTTIIPLLVAKWDEVTFSATIPENTTLKIQILDEVNNVYADSQLSGNSTGFSQSPIDLSNLSLTRLAVNGTNARFPRLRLKVTMSTSDINVTPSLDLWSINWTRNQGDLSTAALASTSWPTILHDSQSTMHTSHYNSQIYPAIRWVKSYENGMYTLLRGLEDNLILHTGGGYREAATVWIEGQLTSINRNTGTTNWERPLSGSFYTSGNIALSQNNTLYNHCIFMDTLSAYDAINGMVKWSYQFYGGHGTYPTIAPDGTIYVPRYNGTFSIYAFNPDGTTKWTYTYDPPGTSVTSTISLGSDGTVYFGYYTYSGSTYTNNGKLVALNPSDGSEKWIYNTGNVGRPVVDTDGTIYVANSITSASTEKKIYAINPNGTLKWEYSIGASTDYWPFLSLRSDNILLAGRKNSIGSESYIDAVNTVNGRLVWYHANHNYLGGEEIITDGLNGYYYSDPQGVNYEEGDYYSESTTVYYFDNNATQKWKLIIDGMLAIGNSILDEDGRFYLAPAFTTLVEGKPNSNTDSKLIALFPWTLSVFTNPSPYYHPGDTLTFIVTTAMQQTNLLTEEANYVQVVLDNGEKVALSYSSTNTDGNTVWRGSWILPSNYTDGTHSFTVEASAANIQTDISLNFANPASNSNNTGINTTGSFTVDDTAPSSPDFLFPKGYCQDCTKPTLFFKKATDAISGVSSYSVSLDERKNKSYSVTGIPSVNDISKTSSVWRDNANVKVEFFYENDSDSTNDEIRVYLKDLDSNELTEGKHSWRITAYDNASNAIPSSVDFYIDRTSPSISELAIADVSSVSPGGEYKFKITNRIPSFSGKALDSYQGSKKINTDGTKDTFDKVSSGPDKLTLTLKRLKDQEDPNSANPVYENYLTKEYSLADIKDDPNNEKYTRFYITAPYPLADGYYQVNLSLKDKAGNIYEHPAFYLVLEEKEQLIGGLFEQGKLQTEIIEKEKIPAETEEEKERIKEEGYTVKVKVVDINKNPVKGAKVTLFSEPKEALTDEEGIAAFDNVEKGEHKIVIAYKGQTGKQKVNLGGKETKEFDFTIQIKQTNPLASPLVILIVSSLTLIIVGLSVWIYKIRRGGKSK